MQITTQTDTIIAQCTPSGTGALALIRISGPQACAVIGNKISQLSSKKLLSDAASHTIHHGYIVDEDNKPIDEVLFFIMHAPRTFTGEHTVEISCHNNPFVIENIIERCIQAGARLAQPGEFSRQAIENGKMNILQAEAIKELIHAQTQEALKLSLQQVRGTFSQHLQTLETSLLKATALCEASFEFLEEDVSFSAEIMDILNDIQTKISSLTLLFNQQKQIRDGIRIALIGTVNAGKSSLFNALIGKNRAIVTNIAGTTRDSIEYGVYQDGHYWTVIDTAGLRITDDAIEQEGINRSYTEAETADIVLFVIDGARQTDEELHIHKNFIITYPEKCITVINKLDLLTNMQNSSSAKNVHTLCVSAQTQQNIPALKEEIMKKIDALFSQTSSSFLLNKRHYSLLQSCSSELAYAQNILSTSGEFELISLHLQKALSLISELTGKSISEKTMDSIFKDFCIGK